MTDDMRTPETLTPDTSWTSGADVFHGSRIYRTDRNSNRIIVAIPMKDEADFVEACLTALTHQTRVGPDEILVLVNNSTDRGVNIARGFARKSPIPVLVADVTLPPEVAHAGGARRNAMQWAATRTGDQGVLLTTDADGVVGPNWIEINLAAIQAGADVVAGRSRLDPIDEAKLPPDLVTADANECEYAALLDEIDARLDSVPWDPWPRHDEHSGASIAVTKAAYQRAGGMPCVASGEDRQFFAELRRVDARIRHAKDAVVTVSGRTEGRAAGGMADTIRRRLVCPDAFLDSRLEPAREAIARIIFRHRLRILWRQQTAARSREINRLAIGLEVPVSLVRSGVASPYFGSAWATLEAQSPRLRRQIVPVTALSEQINVARGFLEVLDGSADTDQPTDSFARES